MTFPTSFSRLGGAALAAFSLALSTIRGADPATKPDGRILYQPQLLWADSMSTLQGTGYVIEHQGKFFGVTSVHFMNFDAGGLRSATWLDVYSEQPLATFRTSLGRPARTAITLPAHAADDFVLLPLTKPPEEGAVLELESVDRYEIGTRVWFPNKNRENRLGHVWLDGTVTEDAGNYIVVRFREPVVLESQSGSPLLHASTGKVLGMIQGGREESGQTLLTLCPARSLVKFLGRRQPLLPLTTSIRRRR